MRIVKHLGARVTIHDAATVLALIPFFPGERPSFIKMSAYAASSADQAIDQTGETNWYGISVPWQLVVARNMTLPTPGTIDDLSTVTDWNDAFSSFLRASDPTATNVFWGGDIDADPNVATGAELTETESESVVIDAQDPSQSLMEQGVPAIGNWFTRETFLRPLAAEGNTVIRFGDEFEYEGGGTPQAFSMGGVIMVGVVRSEAETTETNFNIEVDDAYAREALGLMLMGDYASIEKLVQTDGSARGDWIRTVLFGGDNYIEANTLKGPTLKSFVKMKVGIDSPIQKFDR